MIKNTENPYYNLFLKQKNNQLKVAKASRNQRVKKLNALQRAIEITYRNNIKEALKKDLGKPSIESEMTEVYQIIGEIKHAKANLHKWRRDKKVKTPLSMLGASSYIKYEPKGVCLIISPWNFPFNLTFGPLVSAIAAGNTAIIKPSEMTPNSSALMKQIVASVFDEDEVALVEGEIETSTQLLKLPFNHIFFTGSPMVGKIVMKAASEHLSSVTLELGGKSPTIIDETANLKTAAKKIMWGKFMNCGQICVSPDYVLIDKSVKEKFISECKGWLDKYYDKDPKQSDAYGRIVTSKHFNRLANHLEDAKLKNATIHYGAETDESTKYISPTLISDLKDDASLLHEEIFGPILPIVSYDTLENAIAYINSKERPLALYVYSKSRTNTNKVISNTRAGSTCINNNVIQYANHHLPFGGINNSGIGKSHGYYGFKAFSNERSVVKQNTYGITELLFPPYTNLKEKLAKLTVKWF
ncbi:MAG: aldehyde dehydrogenase family protein [Winogradskyella sp.]|uniref:aldehyde dehydrogenase family protein n=1 Tax=Winogradskyella sp. TaxID=1883156 RepID=UPI000F3FD1D8|nr:aldehyde dehydrogenase family protein [Winogradskyella sp.]RNC88426.1 MAG: aldehyde dehydrogenase family protein [Winogradskyella sp.]